MSDAQTQNQEIQGFDDPPVKTPKWVKYLGGTAIGIVLIAGGVSVVASQLFDQQKYKNLITEKVAAETGYQIDWNGDIALSLLPLPHATIHDLTVSANDQKILTVKTADVEVALAPLLSGKIKVNDIGINEPNIMLVTLKDGTKTWMTEKIKNAEEKKEPAQEGEAAEVESGSGAMDISFDTIEISNGTIVWDDQSSKNRQTVENLDFHLNADGLSGPFEMKGGLLWNSKKLGFQATTGELDAQNGLYPLQLKLELPDSQLVSEYSGVISAKDQLSADGDLTIRTADLSSAIKSFSSNDESSLPSELNGEASLSSKVEYGADKIAFNNLEVKVGELGYKGEFSILGIGNEKAEPKVSFDLKSSEKSGEKSSPLAKLIDDIEISATGFAKDNKLKIEKSHVIVSNTDFSVTGTLLMGEQKPNVDLFVEAKRLDIDQIQREMGSGGTQGRGSSQAGTDSQNAGEKGSFGGELPFEGHLRAKIKEINFGGKKYSEIESDLTANGNSLRISNLSASLPGPATIKTSGTIGNAKAMSGLDLMLAVDTPNAELLAGTYDIKLPELPQKIGAASLSGKVKGDMDSLGFDTSVKLWGISATGAGTVASPLGTPSIDRLKLSMKHPSFAEAMRIVKPDFSATAGFSGPLDFTADISLSDKQYRIDNIKAVFGRTTAGGSLNLSTLSKPSLSGDLKLGDVVFPSSSAGAKESSGGGVGGKGAPASKARWSREAVDVAWMREFDADLKISAASITQNLWRFTNANLDFILKDGTLRINDMSSSLFGGQASLNGEMKSGSGEHDPLSVSGKMNASNVDAQKLQSALMGKPSDTLSGTITSVDIGINATGLSPSDLVQTLGGQGNMTGKNLIVKGVDAAQLGMAAKGSYKPLERAGTMFGSFGQGQTEFTTFESAFDIRNGIVDFTKVFFDGPKATLESTGNINLPLWTIDLKNTMTVKNTDIPPFDFTIRGPLDNPAKAGGSVIEDYLRTKMEKKATKMLGKLLGVPEESPPPTGTTPADPIDPSVQGEAPEPTVEAQPQEKTKPKDQLKKEALKALGGLLGQ